MKIVFVWKNLLEVLRIEYIYIYRYLICILGEYIENYFGGLFIYDIFIECLLYFIY